jgi:hypothetical protein
MADRTPLRFCLPLVFTAALAACSGSGQGLDMNGNPIGSSSGSGGSSSGGISADFQSIQDHVFTPICAQCHAGAGAPEGLQLSEGQSYDMTVNHRAQENPLLFRIKPGDADNSYLVQKIMGTAAVGSQMPDGCPQTQPCLDQATIDAIRQWVANGAPESGS